jgi:hypothetical protein
MNVYNNTRQFILDKYSIDLDQEQPDYRLSDGNSKLKADGIVSFNLIPIIHCPMAGACKSFCYATVGQQAFKNGVLRRARAFLATTKADFVPRMIQEVSTAVRRGARAVRVHDSGDFYSYEYMLQWFEIARANPSVRFYAYTKMVALVRLAHKAGFVPDNFRLIQSLGGLADKQIDRSLPHSRIFSSLDGLLAAGYSDASESDAPAAFGDSPLIGLVIHGARSKRFDASVMDNTTAKDTKVSVTGAA